MRSRSQRRALTDAMQSVNTQTPLTDDERASLAALAEFKFPTQAPDGLLDSLVFRGYVETRRRPHKRTGEIVTAYAITDAGRRALER